MFKFASTSVLLVYDGAPYSDIDDSTTENTNTASSSNSNIPVPARADARLIDFQHVFPLQAGAVDENILFGLKKLEAMLEKIAAK